MRELALQVALLAGVLGTAGCVLGRVDGRLDLAHHEVVVPVALDDGVPLVDVWIGGEGPFLFKLDTGSGPCVIADDLVARLDLPLRHVNGSLTGANGEVRRVDQLAHLPPVRLAPGAVLREVRAFVLGSTDLDVHDRRRPVQGILGYAVFLDCTLAVDYGRSELSLSRVPLPEPDGSETLAMTVHRKTPRVRVSLAGEPFDVLVDTGNDQALIVPPEQGRTLPFVDPPSVGPLLSTVTGTVRVEMGRIAGDLAIAGHRVQRPVISLMKCSEAMIGAEILQHFRVSLDARRRRARFERDTEDPVTVASRVSDGLGLRRAEGGWEVVDVIPGSPAERQQVRVGDAVRLIDYLGRGRYRIVVGRDGAYREVVLRAHVLVR